MDNIDFNINLAEDNEDTGNFETQHAARNLVNVVIKLH